MEKTFQWSGRHVRIRNELFILSVIIFLAAFYGAKYNPESFLPITLIKAIPEGTLVCFLRVLWLYFFVSLCVLTFDERSTLNAFRTDLDKIVQSLKDIASEMNDPEKWSDKILPAMQVQDIIRESNTIQADLKAHAYPFGVERLNERHSVVQHEVFKIKNLLKRTRQEAELVHLQSSIAELNKPIENLLSTLTKFETETSDAAQKRETFEGSFTNFTEQMATATTSMENVLNGGIKTKIDELVKSTEETATSIEKLQNQIARDRSLLTFDRMVLSAWIPIIASLGLVIWSFFPPTHYMNSSVILSSAPL